MSKEEEWKKQVGRENSEIPRSTYCDFLPFFTQISLSLSVFLFSFVLSSFVSVMVRRMSVEEERKRTPAQTFLAS